MRGQASEAEHVEPDGEEIVAWRIVCVDVEGQPSLCRVMVRQHRGGLTYLRLQHPSGAGLAETFINRETGRRIYVFWPAMRVLEQWSDPVEGASWTELAQQLAKEYEAASCAEPIGVHAWV